MDILAGERMKQTTVQDPVLPINNCCCCCLITKLYPMLSDPMDFIPPGSSVRGIFQARILEWVAISFSRGSYWTRDRTCVSCCGRWALYHWAPWADPNSCVILRKNLTSLSRNLLKTEKWIPHAIMGILRSILICAIYSEAFSEGEELLEFFKLLILTT